MSYTSTDIAQRVAEIETMPISWKGTLAQYAGRLHRLHSGKNEAHIYDYADLNVPILARMHEMFVMIEWQGRRMGVPLAQLEPPRVDEETKQAVEDWHYRVARGHQLA